MFLGTLFDLWKRAETRVDKEIQLRINRDSEMKEDDRAPLLPVKKQGAVNSEYIIFNFSSIYYDSR